MNIERLTRQIMADEGFSPVAYWDVSRWSIGFGTQAANPKATISFEEAKIALEEGVERSIREYNTVFRDCLYKISDVRAEALCNMLYNLGLTRFRTFKKMIAAIHRGDWVDAACEAQDSVWFRQVPYRARRIVYQLLTGEGD